MSITYLQTGHMVDYTPSGAVTAGDSHIAGEMLEVAHSDIAASTLGAMSVAEYVYTITKETTTDVFTRGQLIYLDSTGLLATGTATGSYFGICTKASGATETTVEVKKDFNRRPGVQVASKSFVVGDMTNNAGTATGYIDMDPLPANALILGWKQVTTVGFTGDTTAVTMLGISGDTDAFSSVTTGSCLAAGTVGSQSKDGVSSFRTAATTPRITITGGADFTNITAGTATMYVYYLICGD